MAKPPLEILPYSSERFVPFRLKQHTGKTTTKQGRPIEFDSEKEGLDAGEDNVKLGIV
jgi:hypothetical protein